MKSKRYGDLKSIAAKTDGTCHLCHEPVDLDYYGRTGAFGADTVTVDHLVPQAHGGDDEHDNLLIAHANCNSARGTRDIEEARWGLAGTTDPPSSSDEKLGLSLLGGGLVGFGASLLFGKQTETGKIEPNYGAGVIATALGTAFFRALQ